MGWPLKAPSRLPFCVILVVKQPAWTPELPWHLPASLHLMRHSQCSRHFATGFQIAVMQLCRTAPTSQVCFANQWSWSCLQHCGPQHQMQCAMHEQQTCMRGQMTAAGCKQAPRMGSTCGWLSSLNPSSQCCNTAGEWYLAEGHNLTATG